MWTYVCVLHHCLSVNWGQSLIYLNSLKSHITMLLWSGLESTSIVTTQDTLCLYTVNTDNVPSQKMKTCRLFSKRSSTHLSPLQLLCFICTRNEAASPWLPLFCIYEWLFIVLHSLSALIHQHLSVWYSVLYVAW